MKLKDLIVIALVAVLSFPLTYLVVLFATGGARVEFGEEKKDPEKEEKTQLLKHSARKDSLFAANSRTYQALQLERKEMEKERERLREQQERVNLLQEEVETSRKTLAEERAKLEKVINSNDSLEQKKIKEIAKVYAAMRPSEAANILGTMDNKVVANIIRGISDDRQKAKIISLLSTEKAAQVSKIIGVYR